MDLKKDLNRIISKKVIKSTSGGSAGSILKIKFNNGDCFMIYCDWRLEQNDKVITSSNDDTTEIVGLIAKSVNLLENKKVISIEITKQYDLIISFEDNYSLKVFCNISYSSTEYEYPLDLNWFYSIPEKDLVYTISNDFKVKLGKYS